MFEIMPYGFRRVSAYNPFREMEEMTRSFWNDASAGAFRTDITEKDGVYTLSAELPGFKKEDISIDIEKDCLTVKAERRSEDEEKKTDFVRRERFYGSFTRSFDLTGVNADGIEARYADGILTLTLPKIIESVPESRRIEIM